MRKLLTLALLALLLVSLNACNDSEYHKAAQAAAGISTSLKTAQEVNASLYTSGALDKSETIAIAQAISDTTLTNDQFVAKLRSVKAIYPNNRALIAVWVGELAASVEQLNQAGVLHVKNPDAKAKLSLTIAAIQASVQVIQTAVNQ